MNLVRRLDFYKSIWGKKSDLIEKKNSFLDSVMHNSLKSVEKTDDFQTILFCNPVFYTCFTQYFLGDTLLLYSKNKAAVRADMFCWLFSAVALLLPSWDIMLLLLHPKGVNQEASLAFPLQDLLHGAFNPNLFISHYEKFLHFPLPQQPLGTHIHNLAETHLFKSIIRTCLGLWIPSLK